MEAITKFNLTTAPAYTISKAALNTAVAKFSAQYSKDGVLFISICPGVVEAGHFIDGMNFCRLIPDHISDPYLHSD